MFTASIFASSGRATAARIEAGLARAKTAGIITGPVPKWGFSGQDTPYLAGDDEQRLASLNGALASEADLAWALRGGYGLTRLLPFNNLELSAATVLGFSDVTALLAAVHAAGGTAIHGPVVTSFADADQASVEALKQAWLGERRQWQLRGEPANLEAPVIGGNLEVLTRLIGSEFQPKFARHIVVLEEVGEPWYRCDRALSHLLGATDFGAVSAVVLGDFHDCEAGVAEQLSDRLNAMNIPCLIGAPVGHDAANHAFIWGEMARLDSSGIELLGRRH